MIADIEIRNLTYIINLEKSSAKSYLAFMAESKTIREKDNCNIISSERLKNQYLIIYIDAKPTQNIQIKKICDSLIKNKLDFIVIDELFPNENKYLLQRDDCKSNAEWVEKVEFNKTTSKIYLTIT